jgi:hypothetical protein
LVQAKGLASGATNYLAFAPLTLVPIQKNLIIREQLEEKHVRGKWGQKCFIELFLPD